MVVFVSFCFLFLFVPCIQLSLQTGEKVGGLFVGLFLKLTVFATGREEIGTAGLQKSVSFDQNNHEAGDGLDRGITQNDVMGIKEPAAQERHLCNTN